MLSELGTDTISVTVDLDDLLKGSSAAAAAAAVKGLNVNSFTFHRK